MNLARILGRRDVIEVFLHDRVVIKNEVLGAAGRVELDAKLTENLAIVALSMDPDKESVILRHRSAQFVFHDYGSVAFEHGDGGKFRYRDCHGHSLALERSGHSCAKRLDAG